MAISCWKIPLYVFLLRLIVVGVAADQINSLVAVKSPENDENARIDSENVENVVFSDQVFVPTKDWQRIKPGQAIPSGLHVRLNLETGENEAKLPDDSSNRGRINQENYDENQEMKKTEDNRRFSMSELKEALKKFETEAENANAESDAVEPPGKKFRSYDELKEEFGKMQVNMKTDSEIMRDLFTELKSSTSLERKLAVLDDLEYLVHQIDNAQNFVDMAGFEMILNLLNSTNVEEREMAASITGSSAQSNPKVQIAAMKTGVLHRLIRLLYAEAGSSACRRYLYGISAIIRNFPHAQNKFVELGGLQIFGDILRLKMTDQKPKLKIITLVTDMLNERKDIEKRAHDYSSQSPIQQNNDLLTKLRQYRQIELKQSLVDDGFCSLVAELLSSPEFDSHETVLNAMDVMVDDCRSDFAHYTNKIHALLQQYQQQLQEETDNEFLESLLTSAQSILSKTKLQKIEL